MLENSKPYYDLCVNEKVTAPAVFKSFVTKCIELGYKTIAIDQIFDATALEPVGKKSRKGGNASDILPAPFDVSSTYNQLFSENNFTVLNRITLICKDKEVLHKVLKSNNLKKYHIFAIIPKTSEAMTFSCNDLEVDIISFDPLDYKGIKFSRRLYKRAVVRGIHFELMYYPAIVDQTLRRNIISKAHSYHQIGKSQNIIISSGCNSVLTLRGPYDIVNLGLIFGLSEHQAKNAISSAGADVIKHAIGRRIGKAIIFVTRQEKPEKELTDDQIMKFDALEILNADEDELEPTYKKMRTDNVILLDP